jgi:hypothetical protein
MEMTMDFEDLLDSIDRQVRDFIDKATEVTAEDLGLDRRAAYRLFITDEVIAVPKGDDRVLQYYGGFEYVDKEYRHELGDWVFYSANDDRVMGHLNRYNEVEEEEEVE